MEMDEPLQKAYEEMEEDIKKALREHRGNQSVVSVALNALLAYPTGLIGFGDLIGREFNPETQRREPFLIAATRDLDENFVYAKERRLVEEIKSSLERGRKVQVYAVYTQKRDVTRRLERILAKEGIRVAVLTTEVAPELREAWYERQLRAGVQVVIAHPRLVQTGLDLVEFVDIYFYETGYSIYTLRQASRRSWRIGQRNNVNVKFFYYAGTMQETCLRLMGKKLLVSLAMEGKFATDGLQAIDEGDDILMAMARELVTEKGIGESRRCGVEKARGEAGGSVRSSGRGDITIGNGSRTSGEGCARSHHSTASTDPGSGDATPDVRDVTRSGAAA